MSLDDKETISRPLVKRKVAKSVTLTKSDDEPDFSNYWTVFGFVVLLTLVTRFYKVTEPDHVW